MKKVPASTYKRFDELLNASISAGKRNLREEGSEFRTTLMHVALGAYGTWLHGRSVDERIDLLEQARTTLWDEEHPDFEYINTETGEPIEEEIIPIAEMDGPVLASAFYEIRIRLRSYGGDDMDLAIIRKLMDRLLELLPAE